MTSLSPSDIASKNFRAISSVMVLTCSLSSIDDNWSFKLSFSTTIQLSSPEALFVGGVASFLFIIEKTKSLAL